MIWDVHPGSWIRIFSHPGTRIKKVLDPGSAILLSLHILPVHVIQKIIFVFHQTSDNTSITATDDYFTFCTPLVKLLRHTFMSRDGSIMPKMVTVPFFCEENTLANEFASWGQLVNRCNNLNTVCIFFTSNHLFVFYFNFVQVVRKLPHWCELFSKSYVILCVPGTICSMYRTVRSVRYLLHR
jgi:hypothetical protein